MSTRTVEFTEPVSLWLFKSMIGFFTMIINIVILKNERRNRKSKHTLFVDKIAKIASLLCIVCGLLVGFVMFVATFDVFCYFSLQLGSQLIYSQAIFMGLYQLRRLYFSFSATKVHSNKGYKNWVFVLMYSIGTILLMNTLIVVWFFSYYPLNCGINKHLKSFRKEYESIDTDSAEIEIKPTEIWDFSILFVLMCWDLSTLILYIMKVASFKKFKSEQIEIFNRIMSILNRIVILTAFYDVTFLIILFFGGIITILPFEESVYIYISQISAYIIRSLVVIAMSYSMYLMQEHNTSQYKKLLKLLYSIKCHYCCCYCCKSSIQWEIQLYSDETDLVNVMKKNEENKTKNMENDIDNTVISADPYIKEQHSKVVELSIETTVNVPQNNS